MDTTPEYVKMCRMAKEIQAGRQWGVYTRALNRETREGNFEKGDFIWAGEQLYVLGHTVYNPYEYGDRGLELPMVGLDVCSVEVPLPDGLVWLPRQDQLQEMVKGDEGLKRGSAFYGFSPTFALLHDFWYQVSDRDTIDSIFAWCCSMEQLWLAFVMKIKFGMLWDGEAWK